MLGIAATEPINLLHSVPSKPTQASGKLLPLSAPGGQEDLGPEASSPAPKASGGHEVPGSTPKTQGPVPEASSESLTGQSAEGDFSVDFEKIYTYLSSVSRGGQVPELSAAGEEGGAGTLGVGSLVASPPPPPPHNPIPSFSRVRCGP